MYLMPDVITHYLCSQEAVKKLKNDDLKNMLISGGEMFNFGSQGPDIFYYYHAWPWKNSKNAGKIGTLIHRNETNRFLMASLDYIKALDPDDDGTQALMAYVMGFLSHYVLDKTAHPFIFHFSGINDGDDPINYKRLYDHKHLEVILDTLMVIKLKNSAPAALPQHKVLELKIPVPLALGNYYEVMMKQVFDTSIEAEMIPAMMSDMAQIMRFLYDPKGMKRPIIRLLERLIGKHGAYSTAIYPGDLKADVDYLNLKHSQWCHPCDPGETSTDSFIDLYHRAVDEAAQLIEAAYDYLLGRMDAEELEARIGNLTYEAAIPCGEPCHMKYFNNLFEPAK